MNNLHDNLKKLRNKAGYTQQEVADQLFVTRQCISRWEQGKTIPDIHSLDKLAEMYECKIEDILDNDAVRTFTLDTANKTTKNKRNTYIFLSISMILFIISLTSMIIAIGKVSEEEIYSIQAVITSIDENFVEIKITERDGSIHVLNSDEFNDVTLMSRVSQSLIDIDELKINDTIEVFFDKEIKSKKIKEIKVLDTVVEDNFLGVIIVSDGVEYSSIEDLPFDLQGIRYYYEEDMDFNTNFPFMDSTSMYSEEDNEKNISFDLYYDSLKLDNSIRIGLIYESGINYVQTITKPSIQTYYYKGEHNYSDDYFNVHSYELTINITLNPVSSFDTINIYEYDQNNTLIETSTYDDYLDLKLDHQIEVDTIYAFIKINSMKEDQFLQLYTYMNTLQVFIGDSFDVYASDDYGFVYKQTIYYD
jgi:transcriptional regulator with XRE-family HTH domain